MRAWASARPFHRARAAAVLHGPADIQLPAESAAVGLFAQT